jgi:hypothetical protein
MNDARPGRQSKREKPVSLWPLSLEKALAGAFQVPVKKKPAKRQKKTRKK